MKTEQLEKLIKELTKDWDVRFWTERNPQTGHTTFYLIIEGRGDSFTYKGRTLSGIVQRAYGGASPDG